MYAVLKIPEGLFYFFLAVTVLHFAGHHGQKLGKVYGAIAYESVS